jgi:general stress protein YciG
MAEIGRKGGEEVSQNKEYMSEIGREGGQASHGSGGDRNENTSGQRGFAAMSEEERRRIASKGGQH